MMNEQADFKRTLSIFVDHMRDRRRVLGITQEQLSERSGLSHNYLAKIEIGLKTPSLRTVIRIAKALEMEVSDILAGENTKWLDEAQELAFELRSLPDKEAEFLLKEFRTLTKHIKQLLKT